MRCKTAERWILRSLDGALDPRAGAALEEHLERCPSCLRAREEYRAMTSLLREDGAAAPLPRFWERLEPRLAEEEKIVPLITWERWCLRAVPLFLAVVAVVAGLVAFAPAAPEPMTTSESLLVLSDDALAQSQPAFQASGAEDRGVALIFAADDRSGRRP